MSTSDVDVAREIYEAFNRGDIERVRELFDDGIVNLWRIDDGRAVLHRSWSDTKTLGAVLS